MKRAGSFLIALTVLSATSTVYGSPITMINHGPSSNRVDIVFLGDGYTATDISGGTYVNHINSYVNYMFSPGLNQDPFNRYRNYFNVHRIDVISNQSGADVPQQGISRDTALDATYRFDGVTDRLLGINGSKADAALNAGLSGANFTAEMLFVTVNSDIYGGSGGKYSVYAGGNADAREIALHEMGHSFSHLADEYGGGSPPDCRSAFGGLGVGKEPAEVNVTQDSSGGKWSRWAGYNQPGIGVIGAYEGARYCDTGLYRPSNNSKMRALGNPFDAISREKIILDIYALVDPLDSWLDNGSIITNPASLSVDTIDPEVISVQWFVDNMLVAGASGETFDPLDFGYGPGTYAVTARAFDPTGFDPANGWVRTNASSLEERINWTIQVVPEPSTLTLVSLGILVNCPIFLWKHRQRRLNRARQPRRDDLEARARRK
jgi:IgA Peptidase M64